MRCPIFVCSMLIHQFMAIITFYQQEVTSQTQYKHRPLHGVQENTSTSQTTLHTSAWLVRVKKMWVQHNTRDTVGQQNYGVVCGKQVSSNQALYMQK